MPINPFAAVNLPLTPQVGANPLQAGQSLGAGKIPQAEIDKLPGSIAIQPTGPAAPSGQAFSNFLGQMVQEVNAKQAAAGQTVSGLMAGEDVSLHQAVLAMEEASVSFQLMVEVRNKLLESYQELMRMQI